MNDMIEISSLSHRLETQWVPWIDYLDSCLCGIKTDFHVFSKYRCVDHDLSKQLRNWNFGSQLTLRNGRRNLEFRAYYIIILSN